MSENNSTPGLTDVIRQGARSVVNGIHTALVATVVSYDSNACTASVQPANDDFYADGKTSKAPQLNNLPVHFPTYGEFSIRSDLKVGQQVLVVFAENSIDEWFAASGTGKIPKDKRRFDLQDGIILAGIQPSWDVKATTTDLTIGNNAGGITIKPNGKVSISRGDSELVAVLKSIVQALQSALTTTALGPQPLDPSTQTKLAAALVHLNNLLA